MISNYDAWKTDPDHDYAGQRTYNTPEEEDMLNELRELEEQESELEYQLDNVREYICDIRERLGL